MTIAKRLLIVDDNATDRFLYRRLLKADVDGQAVEEAQTAAAGLALAATFRPECILLDYQMPDQTGVDFLRELRSYDSDVAVVMLTGESDAEVSVAAMKEGADDYLIKGRVTADLLRQAIRSAMAKRAMTQELVRKQQALDLVRSLLDLSSDIFLVVNPDTAELVEAGASGLSRLGYERWGLLDKDLRRSGLLGDKDRAEAFMRRALQSTEPFEGELRRADGGLEAVRVRARALSFGDRCYVMLLARELSYAAATSG